MGLAIINFFGSSNQKNQITQNLAF